MNNASIVGRITKDLELRTTGSGKNVCEFTLAVNRVGEGTDFINCRVWDKQAENLCKYQTKGNLLAVSGSIRVDSYKTEQGESRTRTYVLANNLTYLSTKSSGETKQVEDGFDKNLSKEDVMTLIDDDSLPF